MNDRDLEVAVDACRTPAEVAKLLANVISQLRHPLGETHDLRVVAAVCSVYDVNASYSGGIWRFSTPRMLSHQAFERLVVDVGRAIDAASAALVAGRSLK